MFHVEHINMKIKDYAHTKDSFEIIKIEKGILRTSPIPENMERYYQFKAYISHDNQKKSVIGRIYKTVQQFMFYKKYKLIKHQVGKKDINALDYGCGTGDFVEYLNHKGLNAVGYEPNENASKLAAEKTEILQEISHRSYDVITLFHVLEHIENLDEILSTLHKNLRKEGMLVIAVPNHDSYDASYYKDKWAAWDVPRHIWHFNKTGLIKTIESRQFKHIATKPLWFDALYISMVSEKYKKTNQIKGLFRGLLSNFKARKTKNYSSQVYVFKKA